MLPDKDNRMLPLELMARLVLAVLFCAACLIAPSASPVLSFLALLLFLVSGMAAHALERSRMRGPLASAMIAAADGSAVAAGLAQIGALSGFSFLVILPGVWAALRYSAPFWIVGPVTAGALAACYSYGPTFGISAEAHPHLFSALIFTAAAAGAHLPRLSRAPIEPAHRVASLDEGAADILELREAFRALKDQYKMLQQKSREGKAAQKILDSLLASKSWQRLADHLSADCGAAGIRLYSLNASGTRLVWRASSCAGREAGQAAKPTEQEAAGFRMIDINHASLAAALKREGAGSPSASLIVREKGRVCGLIVIEARSSEESSLVEDKLKPALTQLGLAFGHLTKREDEARRAAESEVLYSIFSLARGASSREVIAERTLNSLSRALPVDCLSLCLVEGDSARTLSVAGRGIEPLNLLSFSGGGGWTGWLRTGSPEVLIQDPSEDTRLNQEEALRCRVRSLCVLPLLMDGKAVGWLSAASSRSGTLDETHMTTLRIALSELGAVLASNVHPGSPLGSGLASPREFVQALRSLSSGTLAAAEITGIESLRRRFGSASVEQAAQRAARLLCTRAPKGSLVCRREDGGFAVLLKGKTYAQAVSWANEVTASASLITLASPDGTGRFCLSLRAKIVVMNEPDCLADREEAQRVAA